MKFGITEEHLFQRKFITMEASTMPVRPKGSRKTKARLVPNTEELAKNLEKEGNYVLGHSQREIRRLTDQAA